MKWWTRSWNPVVGCTHASPGCGHCWAERMASRFAAPGQPFAGVAAHGRWTGHVRCLPERLSLPLHWRRPQSIFVCDMSDLFHPSVPDGFIAAVFGVMTATPRHRYYVLTKRAECMESWFRWAAGGRAENGEWTDAAEVCKSALGARILPHAVPYAPHVPWPLPNVWLGVTVEGPEYLHRLDCLREAPAAHRFVSLEPLLSDPGRIDLRGIDWVVVGGESGPGARPCSTEWVRSVVRQCREAEVPCFVKQLGAAALSLALTFRDRAGADPAEWPEDLRVRELP